MRVLSIHIIIFFFQVIQIQMLNIMIKVASGATLPLAIENISPVRYIKEHIESVEGIEPAQQILKVSIQHRHLTLRVNKLINNPGEKVVYQCHIHLFKDPNWQFFFATNAYMYMQMLRSRRYVYMLQST